MTGIIITRHEMGEKEFAFCIIHMYNDKAQLALSFCFNNKKFVDLIKKCLRLSSKHHQYKNLGCER